MIKELRFCSKKFCFKAYWVRHSGTDHLFVSTQQYLVDQNNWRNILLPANYLFPYFKMSQIRKISNKFVTSCTCPKCFIYFAKWGHNNIPNHKIRKKFFYENVVILNNIYILQSRLLTITSTMRIFVKM